LNEKLWLNPAAKRKRSPNWPIGAVRVIQHRVRSKLACGTLDTDAEDANGDGGGDGSTKDPGAADGGSANGGKPLAGGNPKPADPVSPDGANKDAADPGVVDGKKDPATGPKVNPDDGGGSARRNLGVPARALEESKRALDDTPAPAAPDLQG